MSAHMAEQMGPMNLLKLQSLIGWRQYLLANLLSIAIEEFSSFPSESVFVALQVDPCLIRPNRSISRSKVGQIVTYKSLCHHIWCLAL